MDSLCGNLALRQDTWIQDTWKHLIPGTLKQFSAWPLTIETRYIDTRNMETFDF